MGFGILLCAPIIDLIASKGFGNQKMAYLLTDAQGLVTNFFTFFNTSTLPGVTTGIRVELLILFVLVFWYIYESTRSVMRASLGSFVSYLLLFVIGSIPSFFLIFIGTFTPFFNMTLSKSVLLQNFVHPNINFASYEYAYTIYFDGFMSILLYVLVILLLCVFCFLWDKKKAVALLLNIRFARLATFIVLACAGGMGAVWFYGAPVFIWIDYIMLLVAGLTIACSWMFAAYINDLSDIKIDTISNTERPLITGTLSTVDIQSGTYISALLALSGAYLIGYQCFFFTTIFLLASYLYSCPPLRLKRFFICNTAIIGLGSALSFMIGFYALSGSALVSSIPASWVLLVFLVITLIGHTKDLKDFEGDAKDGVYTIPVVFGMKRARIITAILTLIALVLIPLLSGFSFLWWVSGVFAIPALWIIMRNPFVIQHLFICSVGYTCVGMWYLYTFLI
jgi:4-hydroxybenzoate polyprenyltransferase